MKRTCLFAVATVAIVAGCGSSKPEPSDEAKTTTDSAVTSAAVAPHAAADPSAPAVPPAPRAKPAVAPAVTKPSPATRPIIVPPPPPPAPVVTPTPAPAAAPVPPPAAAPSAPRVDPSMGKPLYDAECRKCHGVVGVPPKVIKEKFPQILPFDAEFFSKTSDDAVVSILMQGKGDDMKSFKAKMTRDEMVAAYIRTLGKR